jgi:hypothetical protein
MLGPGRGLGRAKGPGPSWPLNTTVDWGFCVILGLLHSLYGSFVFSFTVWGPSYTNFNDQEQIQSGACPSVRRRLGLLRYIGAVAFSLWELCVLFHSLGPFLYKL